MKNTKSLSHTKLTLPIIIFFIDAIVLNQGIISLVFVITIVLWRLPKSLFLKYKNLSPKEELEKSLVYGLMALTVFAANGINNQIAQKRAEELIQHINLYKQTHGQYPKSLSNLIPSHIDSIPLAKYTLLFNQFTYINNEQSSYLFYMDIPPFGRPTYNFKLQKWDYVDE